MRSCIEADILIYEKATMFVFFRPFVPKRNASNLA